MPKVMKLVGALLLACAVSVGAQSASNILNGLVYTFPTSDGSSGQVLMNNGAGSLSWITASPGGSAVMPAGIITFANVACPSGYTEYTAASGRYPVGATSGLGGTVGTALTNGENRATGNHTHTASGSAAVSNGNHGHSITDSQHAHTSDTAGAGNYGHIPEEIMYGEPPDEWYDWDYPQPWYRGRVAGSGNSGSSGTGYSVNNETISVSGSVDSFTVGNGGTGTGTNAPYRQLRMCKKS